MDVQRIHDGLWRWSVTRDGAELASAYLEHGEAMLLVDPVLPPPGDDLDRFERAIARDLARLPGDRWVLLTEADDPRDADALAGMTGARAWHRGDPAPAGIEVIELGPRSVALWSQAHGALMPGRAVRVAGGTPTVEAAGDVADRLRALPWRAVIPSVGPMWAPA